MVTKKEGNPVKEKTTEEKPKKTTKKTETPPKLLKLHELFDEIDNTVSRIVGALVMGGYQKDYEQERKLRKKDQNPFISKEKVEELINNYES